MELKKVSPVKAAMILKKSVQFVRRGLIAGKFPFGVAVKSDSGRYSYYISPKLFMDYTGCSAQDLRSD